MAKRIIIIVLVALGIVVAVALLWWWLFNRPQTQPATTGSFGTAQDRTAGGGGGGAATNTGTPLSTTAPGGINSNAGGLPGGVSGGSNTALGDISAGQGGITSAPGIYPNNGTVWLSGSPGSATAAASTSNPKISTLGGAGTVFNLTPVNQVASANPTGGVIPQFGGGVFGGSGGGLGIGGSLGIAGVTGALSCTTFLADITGALSLSSIIAVQTNVPAKNNEDFLSCMTRTIARVALDQITSSVVNWINSGFNGQPSFITNQTQFFGNVADQAAGQFIQGGALAFLCDPFQLQIKIAVAKAYANRDEAQSCTLSQVSGNITSFMNGDFSSGGWPALLSFATEPTNNPYGAFTYGELGLNTSVNSAVSQQQQDAILGSGFLTLKKKENCTVSDGVSSALPWGDPNKSVTGNNDGTYTVCDLIATTPGSVIAQSLFKTEGEGQDSLNMAKNFDEIVNALLTQLMTRTLYEGLGALSGGGGYQSGYLTPDQQQAQTAAQGLLTSMQQDVSVAQQYGTTEQGSIADVQTAQTQLQGLVNCWSAIASSTQTDADGTTTPGPHAQEGAQNAASTAAVLAALNARVDGYNNEITRANTAITLLERLESSVLTAASSADINAITQSYQSAKAQGQILSPSDLTNAQQDRVTLQAQMAAQNQQTTDGLAQCNALAQQ